MSFELTSSAFRLLHHGVRLSALFREGFPFHSFPIQYELELIRYSNLSLCNTRQPKDPMISLPSATAVSFLRMIASAGGKSVILGGRGEPAIYPDCHLIVQAARELELELAVRTNGLYLSVELATALIRFTKLILVEIDAGSAKTFRAVKGVDPKNYKRVMENLDRLVRLKRRNGSKAMVIGLFRLDPDNLKDLHRFLRNMNEIGVDLALVSGSDCYRETISASLRSKGIPMEKQGTRFSCEFFPESCSRNCFCQLFSCFISADKRAFPCKARVEEESEIGDLNTTLLDGILSSTERRKVLEQSSCLDCPPCPMFRVNEFLGQVSMGDAALRSFVFESWML